jgi:hypothetical protein
MNGFRRNFSSSGLYRIENTANGFALAPRHFKRSP